MRLAVRNVGGDEGEFGGGRGKEGSFKEIGLEESGSELSWADFHKKFGSFGCH